MAAMYIVFCVSWDCVKTKNNFRKKVFIFNTFNIYLNIIQV